ncbi:hypothetical protein MTO96_043219 [Rhipicephalus appendiculatus]
MVDMPTRNSRLGSIRQASSSLYVQVRGHGFLCAVALTGFTVALLSLLDTVEAKANERTLPRSGVEGEPEVLRQRQLAKGALSYPIYYPELGDFEIARQTKVQCVYFTEWPPADLLHCSERDVFQLVLSCGALL